MSDLGGCRPDRLDPVLHGNISPGWVLGSSSGSSSRSCSRTYCSCRETSTTAIYIAAVLGFFVLWARTTGQRLDVMVRRRWRLAVVLGLVFAVVLALRRRPHRTRQPAARGPGAGLGGAVAGGRLRRRRRPAALGVPDPGGVRRGRGQQACVGAGSAPSPSGPRRCWPRWS